MFIAQSAFLTKSDNKQRQGKARLDKIFFECKTRHLKLKRNSNYKLQFQYSNILRLKGEDCVYIADRRLEINSLLWKQAVKIKENEY